MHTYALPCGQQIEAVETDTGTEFTWIGDDGDAVATARYGPALACQMLAALLAHEGA